MDGWRTEKADEGNRCCKDGRRARTAKLQYYYTGILPYRNIIPGMIYLVPCISYTWCSLRQENTHRRDEFPSHFFYKHERGGTDATNMVAMERSRRNLPIDASLGVCSRADDNKNTSASRPGGLLSQTHASDDWMDNGRGWGAGIGPCHGTYNTAGITWRKTNGQTKRWDRQLQLNQNSNLKGIHRMCRWKRSTL